MAPEGEAGAPAPLLIGGTRTEFGAGANAALRAANRLRIASVFATGAAAFTLKSDPEGVGTGIAATELKKGLLSSVDIFIYNKMRRLAVSLFQNRTNVDVLLLLFRRPFSSLPAAGRVRTTTSDGTAITTSRLTRRAALTVTPEAAKRLLELQLGRSETVWGIRVGVKTRGCNGVSYTMNWANEKGKNDEVVTIQVPSVDASGTMSTVRILIEPAALLKIAGTIMDFHTSDIVTEFIFTNPNAKGTCGCGESFNT